MRSSVRGLGKLGGLQRSISTDSVVLGQSRTNIAHFIPTVRSMTLEELIVEEAS